MRHAAPELRVPANAVVRVGREFPAALVEPAFAGAVPQVLPHGLGIPVFLFLGNEVAAFDDQNACRCACQRLRDCAAACDGADDDDVVVVVHCPGADLTSMANIEL
jgi:hypothetical protein